MISPPFFGKRTSPLLPYIAAIVVVLIGAGLRLAFDSVAGDLYAFTLYYALVPLIAWYLGLRAGLLAVIFSVVVVNYGLLEPRAAFSLHPPALFGSLSFVIIGAGLAWLGDRVRRSHDQLRAKARELEREVAERKTAEAEVERLNALLMQRVEELQAVIHASPIAIGVATDAAGEHIWGNQAFASLFDVPGESGSSQPLPAGEVLPFKLYRRSVELAASDLPFEHWVRNGGSVRDREIEITRPGGERRTVLANAAPLHDADGRIRGFVGVFVDITERKAAERERDEMNRRKDEFLATLAHELRNPLAPLRNVAAIIQQQEHKDRRWQWVSEVIERQVGHMARLVDDLLDLARVTRGLMALRLEPAELRALVWQAIELVRPLLDQRKQRLHVELPVEPARLRVDRVRMTQVIANVLNNAVKYTPEGGSILVSAQVEGSEVRLKVRDSGRGIAAELLPRIFEVFIQGDRSLARTEGGLGIGLPLVKKLVELHEGRVTASSPGPGKGTEIVVTLPLPADTETKAGPGASEKASSSRRILVVDDNADVADTLAMLLGAMGHEVRTAYSGAAALSAARSFEPAVALIDIGLPDIDGYALAARFRSDPALRHVRLIALSGYGGEHDHGRSDAAGFARHLTKPYRLEQLEAAVAELDATDHGPRAAGDRLTPHRDLAVD